jgi:hypothetical protein
MIFNAASAEIAGKERALRSTCARLARIGYGWRAIVQIVINMAAALTQLLASNYRLTFRSPFAPQR